MLEGYTTLSFRRGQDGATAFPAPRGRRDVPPPGTPGEDGHHARRPLRGSSRARTGGRVVRARAPRAGRPVPAARGALRTTRGDPPDLFPDVERRQRPVRRHALPTGRDPVLPAAGQRRHGRGYSSEAVANARRCGSLRPTPTRATSSATSRPSRTRSRSCGGTATRSGRDPAEIEVTALIMVSDDADRRRRSCGRPRRFRRRRERVRSSSLDRSRAVRWLEKTWAPVLPRLAAHRLARRLVSVIAEFPSSVILQSRAASSSGRAGDF